MKSNTTLEEARRRLWYWRRGGDSYSCQLYSLMMKADPINQLLLRLVYPNEFAAFKEWYESPSEEAWELMWGEERPTRKGEV